MRKVKLNIPNNDTLIIRFNLLITFLAIIVLNTSSISLEKADAGSYAVRTIIIDAGHGGKDPGTMGKIAKEKDIALNIALKLGGYIEKYIPDTKVIYTRKSDKFIPLQGRAEIANKNNADLFVSIHVNSISGKPSVAGTETYVMGLHKEEANLKVAMRENSVIRKEENFEKVYEGFDPDSDESYIIFHLYQSAFFESSVKLAEKIQTQFGKRVGRHDRGVKQAGFWVLWSTTMPSVLVETGYITNPEEEKYLNSTEGQALLASGIFRAVRDYVNDVEQLNIENK
ncbi:MAG: N-acetylmuramoyl-L-alanine amidase [Cyclobacteriaceae bacterium]|nr:N-acetylmuramoyl-L-alanine amidase [Cyclobacteriaceae bacterium]